MGLDMYLYRRQYVGGWEWKTVDTDGKEKALYENIINYFGVDRCEDSPHVYIDVCVAYWRKANAVHSWFCNLDGGRDECQPIHVSYDQLRELRDACDSVLRVPANVGGRLEDTAAENGLLPKRGFFFGSYDLDEWYMNDLERTVEMLDKVLASVGPDTWTSFIYQASW